jgi:hypothetical protein
VASPVELVVREVLEQRELAGVFRFAERELFLRCAGFLRRPARVERFLAGLGFVWREPGIAEGAPGVEIRTSGADLGLARILTGCRRKALAVAASHGGRRRRTPIVLPQIMRRSLREQPSCSPRRPIRFVAMDAGTWVALVAALLATVVAVAVPWATFRFAMRQDQVRWVREQRSELYVDMLAEAYAEQEWLKLETAPAEIQERARKSFTDMRLAPVERARLGARGAILGSRPVNRLFNQVSGEAFRLLMSSRIENNRDAIQMLVDLRLGGLIDELREAIRRELGADRVPLDAPGATVPTGNSNAGDGHPSPLRAPSRRGSPWLGASRGSATRRRWHGSADLPRGLPAVDAPLLVDDLLRDLLRDRGLRRLGAALSLGEILLCGGSVMPTGFGNFALFPVSARAAALHRGHLLVSAASGTAGSPGREAAPR